ncbi:MAG: MmgE/PrpD family protein [Hyphomicrobiales bacterium]|nr:MmgE/PrpD family protein [Hyphomicrobiales bacterium]MBV8826327.1 MmgE/PrpD family protein [Hyphomicrobiales bacterium]
MLAEPTQVLARFAAGLSYDAIPTAAREHTKNLLLDALACALAGHQGEETSQVEALAAALAQSEETSIIGGDRLSLAGATLLNGYLITAVTMCDVHRPTLTHVTPEVMPPALAIAERDGRSGRDLLVALAAGCEVMTRIGLGLDWPAARARGWHGPGVLGPFGAAAAVGRLRGFDADTMARAFGLAGSQAAGTYAAWGTPTVKFHQCRGALSGLIAALLAEQKFIATKEFLTAKDGGLLNAYAEGGKPDLATADLGTRWELEQIALRAWPSATSIQGMNTALFDLVQRHRIDPARVKKLRVGLSRPSFDLHGGLARYKGKFEALISAHYTAAVILYDRALTLAQFEPSRYDDPVLKRAAVEQVEVVADPALTGVQATAEIEMSDGSKLSGRCEHPRGSPENPLSRAQIVEKLRTYAPDRISAAAIDEVVRAVDRFEDLAPVRRLMDVLCPEPRVERTRRVG